MRIISKETLVNELVDHPPYETNPELHAKLNVIYLSPDGRTAMAYYEAPEGWFDVEVKDFDEIDYMLEGEVELISADRRLTATPGDCFMIQDGDKFRWQMNKPSRMFFVLHTQSEEVQEFLAQLVRNASSG